jgi:predicted tellurium resistance membrane protein TerC
MPHLLSGETLASFVALTFLEVVLGIDNIVFLAVAVQRLEPPRRPLGRRVGLGLAMILRILMLVGLVWAANLDIRVLSVMGHSLTIKDAVLIAGGMFLLFKGTQEIHEAVESPEGPGDAHAEPPGSWAALPVVVVQIGIINIIFSLDSVITAVGMTNDLAVMIAAVVVSTLMMLFAAGPVAEFIHRRPTTKMLALSFILLIGVALIADGAGFHIPRGYIYFAIAFSLFVELLNSASGRRRSMRD